MNTHGPPVLFRVKVCPHLEYAMEANTPTLRPENNQLDRVQRLAIRLVRGLRHVPYDKSADTSELTLSWLSKLVKAHPISSSTHPKLALVNTPKDYGR